MCLQLHYTWTTLIEASRAAIDHFNGHRFHTPLADWPCHLRSSVSDIAVLIFFFVLPARASTWSRLRVTRSTVTWQESSNKVRHGLVEKDALLCTRPDKLQCSPVRFLVSCVNPFHGSARLRAILLSNRPVHHTSTQSDAQPVYLLSLQPHFRSFCCIVADSLFKSSFNSPSRCPQEFYCSSGASRK